MAVKGALLVVCCVMTEDRAAQSLGTLAGTACVHMATTLPRNDTNGQSKPGEYVARLKRAHLNLSHKHTGTRQNSVAAVRPKAIGPQASGGVLSPTHSGGQCVCVDTLRSPAVHIRHCTTVSRP